ncbi:MAG: nucleotidyltransferase family protein [Lachnospiraceae bacterium]|nr:nucleotidyltransferase family protein [Lachnospiraceae bacterium]
MNHTEKILLQLTARALFDSPTDFEPASTDWAALYREASSQSLTILLWDALTEEERRFLPKKVAWYWEQDMLTHLLNNEQLLREQQQVIQLLTEAKIPCVILKGSSAAIYYPNPALRTMGDIDILVKPEQQMEVVHLLQGQGYGDAVGGEHHCHVALHKEDYAVEVHREVNGLFLGKKSKCVQRIRRYLEDALERRQYIDSLPGQTDSGSALSDGRPNSQTDRFDDRQNRLESRLDGLSVLSEDQPDNRSISLGDRPDDLSVTPEDQPDNRPILFDSSPDSLPVLADDQQAVVLLLHKLEHFLTSGLGLRQVCDWAVFVKEKLNAQRPDGKRLWKNLEPLLKDFGLLTFAGVMTRVCIDYLVLPREAAPWAMAYDGQIAEKVIEQVLREGNFGKKVDRYGERLFADPYSSNRVISFIRVLNDACREHWPICDRHQILMPVAPFVLLGRYCVQRKKGERPRLRLIQKYRQGGRDQKLYKELKPFIAE